MWDGWVAQVCAVWCCSLKHSPTWCFRCQILKESMNPSVPESVPNFVLYTWMCFWFAGIYFCNSLQTLSYSKQHGQREFVGSCQQWPSTHHTARHIWSLWGPWGQQTGTRFAFFSMEWDIPEVFMQRSVLLQLWQFWTVYLRNNNMHAHNWYGGYFVSLSIPSMVLGLRVQER